MIVDTFVFNNEIEVLDIRLNTLSPIVDKFVIVEAELTQSLLPKPLYFQENKQRFEPFLDKIIHVVIKKEECPDNSTHLWEMENFTRNCISRGLVQLQPDEQDIIILSDCDEIPNPNVLKRLLFTPDSKIHRNIDQAIAFEGFFNAYYLNLHCPEKNWVGSTVFPYWMLNERSTPQHIRANKDYYDRVGDGDATWHFSYLGGYEKVWLKYASCIEPTNKNCLSAFTKDSFQTFFQERVIKEKCFIYADKLYDKSVKLKELSMDKLPRYVQEQIYTFDKLLFKENSNL